MKLTHHGHACIEIDILDTKILVDPGSFSSFEGVVGADVIIVTHQHADHLDMSRLDRLRRANNSARWYADPQTVKQLREVGVEAHATVAGETYRVGNAFFEGVGSTHAEIHPYIERIDNVGVVISAQDEPRLFHPGDSLEGRPTDIDYLCVPVTAPWGAVKEMIAFVRAVEPRRLIPIHDRTASPAGRTMYLKHIGDYGLDGGVEVIDIDEGDSRELA